MSKFFVTGGAGFIGSHLVDRLMKFGEVTVYDNLSSGKFQFIEHNHGKDNFHFIEGDLLDFENVKKQIAGHEMVFHLAANPDARKGTTNTGLDLEQGTIVTHNVLEAMRLCGIQKIVFSSSGTVYGETPIIPLAETYGPLLPISLYGASKLACEGLISAYVHLFHFQAWIFRFANVIGDRATHGVIYDFIKKLTQNSTELKIMGNGKQEKPYFLVDDCVEGILFAIKKTNDSINVINLGCESSTSVTRIAEIVASEMGLPRVKFNYAGGDRGWPGDVPQVRFNIDKMKALGWKPKVTSDEAVTNTARVLYRRK
jgi:UDP-glucose 4-epimerase